jgi:hypothetical protein
MASNHYSLITRSKNVLGALGAGALVVVFWFVQLGNDPLFFWNDDYEVSILPVFADVARSWSEGNLPLLSPSSWVCGNLAGEFQYGTFSVFVNAAVVWIWKLPLSFPQQAAALSMTHLFVLGMGGYLLARRNARQAGNLQRLSCQDWCGPTEGGFIPQFDANGRNPGRIKRTVDVRLPALVAPVGRNDFRGQPVGNDRFGRCGFEPRMARITRIRI